MPCVCHVAPTPLSPSPHVINFPSCCWAYDLQLHQSTTYLSRCKALTHSASGRLLIHPQSLEPQGSTPTYNSILVTLLPYLPYKGNAHTLYSNCSTNGEAPRPTTLLLLTPFTIQGKRSATCSVLQYHWGVYCQLYSYCFSPYKGKDQHVVVSCLVVPLGKKINTL
jgi:hypothetical protein